MEAFFAAVRSTFGTLNQAQVDGLNAILDASIGHPLQHRAYMLATAWHETGAFKFTHEIWGPTAQQKKYEPPSKKASELGNTIAGDSKRFMGRGYVQITGRRNYAKASLVCTVDLVKNPDLAAEPKYAAMILVDGMTKGWFTGKSLASFGDYTSMRRVVNGNDRAELIAGYARSFERALASPGSNPIAPDCAELRPIAPDAPKPSEPPKVPAKPMGLLAAIIELLKAIFGRKTS